MRFSMGLEEMVSHCKWEEKKNQLFFFNKGYTQIGKSYAFQIGQFYRSSVLIPRRKTNGKWGTWSGCLLMVLYLQYQQMWSLVISMCSDSGIAWHRRDLKADSQCHRLSSKSRIPLAWCSRADGHEIILPGKQYVHRVRSLGGGLPSQNSSWEVWII